MFGKTFTNSLEASLQHNAKEQTAPFREEDGRDVVERLRNARFKLNPPLVLEITAQHKQHLPGELKYAAPTPTRLED